MLKSDLPGPDADGPSVREADTARQARLELHAKREMLKKTTGSVREQLTFPVYRMDANVELTTNEGDHPKND